MSVNQLFVNPVARLLGQFLGVDFSSGQHHLALLAADDIAVNVHIGKVVISANGLDLGERVF